MEGYEEGGALPRHGLGTFIADAAVDASFRPRMELFPDGGSGKEKPPKEIDPKKIPYNPPGAPDGGA